MEKINTKSVFRDLKKNKIKLHEHILPMLIYLAILYGIIFLTITSVDFLGIILFFFLLLPATVIYIEYASLVEAGAKPENFSKLLRQLFSNAFRSGRTFLLFSFKTLLYIFLATIVSSLLLSSGITLYDFMNGGVMIAAFNEAAEHLALGNVDLYIETIAVAVDSLELYAVVFAVVTEFLVFLFLVYAFNKNSFLIYADMFIERRPNVKMKTVMDNFFNDPQTKKKRRRVQFVSFLIVGVIFAMTYFASFILLYTLAEGGAGLPIILLRTNLVSFLIFVLTIPFLIRFNYYLYQQIARTKRINILEFSINEIGLLMNFENIPEQMQQYLEIVKNLRIEELKNLQNTGKTPEKAENKNDENADNTVIND